MEMKINIHHKIVDSPWGGGNQFLKALRDYLRAVGQYSESPHDADIILVNGHHFINFKDLKVLRKYKSENDRILIHRVDGPLAEVRGGDNGLDVMINYFNHHISDGTIFQSTWSRDNCLSKGMKHNTYESTITNAADPSLFFPSRKKKGSKGKIKLITSSWSSNIKKGFDIYKFLDDNLDFTKYEMTFVGNSPISFKNLCQIAPKRSEELGDILRSNDIFITASINDPCSNSLIEALSCGLPAVVRNSGGHPELIGEGGLTFEGARDILSKIDEVAANLASFRGRIKAQDMDTTGAAYYDFCKRIHDKAGAGEYTPKRFKLADYLRLSFESLRI